jgi:hypothetical protein
MPARFIFCDKKSPAGVGWAEILTAGYTLWRRQYGSSLCRVFALTRLK